MKIQTLKLTNNNETDGETNYAKILELDLESQTPNKLRMGEKEQHTLVQQNSIQSPMTLGAYVLFFRLEVCEN